MSQRLSAPARREQILDVALDVFANSGFHGASMNDIAEAAGVTKPVLYQHFDSKRDLYQALIEEVGNRLRTNIDKATAEATNGKSQTELGFRAYFRWVADDHDGFRLLFGSGSRRDDEFNEAIRKITAESARAVAPLIAVDIDESHRETLAQAVAWSASAKTLILTRSPLKSAHWPGLACAPSLPKTESPDRLSAHAYDVCVVICAEGS